MEKSDKIKIINSINDIEIGLNNIYATLQEVNIKATPHNTRYIFGIYSEIDRLTQISQMLKEVGGEDVQ